MPAPMVWNHFACLKSQSPLITRKECLICTSMHWWLCGKGKKHLDWRRNHHPDLKCSNYPFSMSSPLQFRFLQGSGGSTPPWWLWCDHGSVPQCCSIWRTVRWGEASAEVKTHCGDQSKVWFWPHAVLGVELLYTFPFFLPPPLPV